ncbi:MAG: terminase [Burkholderiales bacterium]|jgi:hypothetical protein|nr:terminase [Burkholderiales bacterium]
MMDQIEALLPHLTSAERRELDALLLVDVPVWSPLSGAQSMAYASEADIIGYGGAAGGGKTDLACGLALTRHSKSLIMRREGTQLIGITDRFTELLGSRDGYNGQERIWRLKGRQIEFGSVPNDTDWIKYQGRPHDLLVFDEAANFLESQVRALLGWLRSTDPRQRKLALMTFNPPTTVEGRWIVEFFAPWLDTHHPNPAKPGELRWFATVGGKHDVEMPSGDPVTVNGERITPMSRTFIPARVTDNPHLANTGYMTMLQALPEPLRSQLLYGDFSAGVGADPWQVIPAAWVEAAMARWRRPDVLTPMDSMGVDVARGGEDRTILARRHGMWFDDPLVYPGAQTPSGSAVAGLVVAALRNQAVVHIDVIGVGASPFDFLRQANQQVVGVNVAERARGGDFSGRLTFKNLRSELWWRMREALDPERNTGIALPPSPELRADLCAPTFSMSGADIYVASRDEIIKRVGRSPDYASAYILALMDTPKLSALRAVGADRYGDDYDPYK